MECGSRSVGVSKGQGLISRVPLQMLCCGEATMQPGGLLTWDGFVSF